MLTDNTDQEWEKIGAEDPYYGVSTENIYQKEYLTEEIKEKFFETGSLYLTNIFENIKKHIDSSFRPKRALDFGCGVGRIVIPIAEIAEHVVGVDISDSMLKEARRNCQSRSINNVTFLKSDDLISNLSDSFDFIHSFIVFQHIPIVRGELIFQNLLSHLEHGGIGVFHFTYGKSLRFAKLIPRIKKYIPFAKNFINLMKGKKIFAPQMQMNSYDLNSIFFVLQKNNIKDFYTEFTNHNGELGVILYFKMS
jgi:2-polyprenyl-3-methyl-5-hydroxy-6-metoxy-1,4-benzoquinol methylase